MRLFGSKISLKYTKTGRCSQQPGQPRRALQ